jgi:Bacterial cadherin-like domain
MANWVIANDANALLIDTSGNSTQTYTAAVPMSSSGGVLSLSLLAAAVGLDQTNLIATFDGNASTSGKSPVLRLRLASSSLPDIGEQDFTFQWKLTMGLDSTRDYGERQVYIPNGLSVHVGPVTDGRILLYANAQSNKQVMAISGAGNPFSANTSFSTQDVIGQVFVANGAAYLDIYLMGLISKLDANAGLLFSSLTGYTPETLLLSAYYNLTLTGLPLVSATGEAQTLSVVAPIEPWPNHAPVFDKATSTLALTEDTAQSLTFPVTDPEGQNVTLSVLGTGADTVTATVSGNQLTVTPASHFNSTTGVALQVKATDVYGAYNLQDLLVTVAPVDDPAVLQTDSARLREGLSITGNVLRNDTDIDSALQVQTFYFTGAPSNNNVAYAVGSAVALSGLGSFTLNASGDFTWQSQLGFSGDLPVVHYVTSQGQESTLSATVVPVTQVLGTSQLSGKVAYWAGASIGPHSGRHSLVDGVQVTGLDELSTPIQSLTDASGSYSLTGFQPASTLPLTLSKSVGTSAALTADVKAAITLSDVLDALKIYLNKPATSTSAYRYVAADFDANGSVNLSDVLSLLKAYLGKTGATAPSWAFVDAQADVSGLGLGAGKAQVASELSHTFAEAGVIQNSHHWVAVLRGDVNGSWASATPDVENLSNGQFLQLIGVSSGSV